MPSNCFRRKVDERSNFCSAQLSFRVHQVNVQSSVLKLAEVNNSVALMPDTPSYSETAL